MPTFHSRQGLSKELGVWDATALVVGCIIGAGIFRVPSAIAAELASPYLILLVWLLGGFLAFCGALCYVELAGLYPKAGGDYVYLRETYGRLVSFLFGWTKLFVERTGTLAILAFVFSEYLLYSLNAPRTLERPLAAVAILALTAINIVGVRFGKWVQNSFTVLKVLALTLIVFLGIVCLVPTASLSGRSVPLLTEGIGLPSIGSVLSSLGVALIFVLWTYGGWNETVYVSEEMRDPGRDLRKAVGLGLGLVTVLYLLVNLIYLVHLPVETIRDSDLVASALMEKLVGSWGGRMVGIFVAVSSFGALNGYILTGGRILYALAQDHALFRRLSPIHERFRTPAIALLFNTFLSLALLYMKTFEQLLRYTTISISLFFALNGLAVISLRRKLPSQPRPYRVPGYPWVPVIFVLTTFLFIGNALASEPADALFGLFLTFLGLPLYWLSQRLASRQ